VRRCTTNLCVTQGCGETVPGRFLMKSACEKEFVHFCFKREHCSVSLVILIPDMSFVARTRTTERSELTTLSQRPEPVWQYDVADGSSPAAW
jgi:hypothetical protein